MNLYLDTRLAEGYKSPAQIARVLTESWMKENGYCPNCRCKPIKKAPNNLPVQDFLCPNCDEQFELKSKSGNKAGNTINDGAYQTMIERIQANDNPSFFFLSYRRTDYSVQQLMLVPKHFMTAEMIKPRKALLETAKRAGWIGCVIDIRNIPESGKILLINRTEIIRPEQVQAQWKANLFLREQKMTNKGWLLAIMRCIDRLPEHFDLNKIYTFEQELALQFPKNNHIKEKIRQQLQILRDQGVIEFLSRGKYRRISL